MCVYKYIFRKDILLKYNLNLTKLSFFVRNKILSYANNNQSAFYN